MLLLLLAPVAHAQLPGLVSNPLPNGGQSWSLPVQTLVFITALTFIPAVLLLTSFTRIIIVFGLLRNQRPDGTGDDDGATSDHLAAV